MSNIADPMAEYFAAAGITDPNDIAYIKRYSDVAAAVPTYGANTAKLHWQNFGHKEGRTWGVDAPVAAAAPAAPVATPANTALPASYGTDAASWDAYMQSARQATEGMNQMPFVYDDYGSVPIDNAAANALFYPQGSATTAAASNPLLAAAATAPTQASSNPLLAAKPVTFRDATIEDRIARQYGFNR